MTTRVINIDCRRIGCMLVVVGGLICVPVGAFGQNTPGGHVPLQKTIGQSKPDVVPSLIVLNSKGATLSGGKLTLTGVTPNSIIFADRPVRAAGHDLTAHIIEDWAKGSDNFAKDPPNATVSGFTKDGSGVRDAVVVLKNPKLEGDQLTFDVDVLEGDLKGADGAAAIFIDIIGRPFTPLSFAGVARRSAYRGGVLRRSGRCRRSGCRSRRILPSLWLPTAGLRLLPLSSLLLAIATRRAVVSSNQGTVSRHTIVTSKT